MIVLWENVVRGESMSKNNLHSGGKQDNLIKETKKIDYRRRERIKDFMCVVPALIFLIIFVYYPIVHLFKISFTDWNLIKEDYKFVGLKNYRWLFRGSGFPEWVNSLKITLTYTVCEVVITIVGGILLALLFNRSTKAFGFMRSAVFMPKYIAVSTSGVIFIWILHKDYGVLNQVLMQLGFNSVPWLTSEKTALMGVLILTTWRVVGYSMMLYISAMNGISQDYYEAAALDGANGFKRFRYITLPLLSPTTIFIFVTTFIASMKVFQSIDVMTGGGPYKATNVMVYWIYNLAFVDFRVDRAAVVSIVFFIILLICTAITLKISDKSVSYDS